MLLKWIILVTLQHITNGVIDNGQRLADCRYPETNAFYKIISSRDKKSKTVVQDRIVMFPYVGWDNQQWQFVPVGQGFFKIQSKDSAKIMSMDSSLAVVISDNVDEVENHWYMLNSQNHTCNIYSRRYKLIVAASGKAGNSTSKHQWKISKVKEAPLPKQHCYVPRNDAIQTRLVSQGKPYLLKNARTTHILTMELFDLFVKHWILTPEPFECGLYTIHSDIDRNYVLAAGHDGDTVTLEMDDPRQKSVNTLWSVVREEETFFAIVSRSTLKVLANKIFPNGTFGFYLSTWKLNRRRQQWSFITPNCDTNPKHYYAVVATSTGMALTLEDKNITQRTFRNTDEQLWQAVKTGQFYFFKSKSNGQYVAHDDNRHVLIPANEDSTGDESQWSWYKDAEGTCVVYAKGSKLAIGVADNSTRVTLHTSSLSQYQKWHFIKQMDVKIGSTCFSSPDDAFTTKLINSIDGFIIANSFFLTNLQAHDTRVGHSRYNSKNIQSQLWKIRTVHGSCGYYKIFKENGVMGATDNNGGIGIVPDDSSNTDVKQMWKINRKERAYFEITSRFTNLSLQAADPEYAAPKRGYLWKFYTPGCSINSSFLYAIGAFHSGLVMTVEGEHVVQRSYHGLKTQMWRFVHTGNGFYHIRSSADNRLLTVRGDWMLIASKEESGSDRQWYLETNVAGTCSLFARKYKMYADVPLSSRSEGRRVMVFFPGTGANQRWTLTKITQTTPFADVCIAPTEDAFLRKMINQNDSYVIMDHKSEKVFHISYDETKVVLPTVLWEYKSCNNTNLFWKIYPVGCGLYKILSQLNEKALTADTESKSVWVEANDETNRMRNQLWSIRHEKETYLSITSYATMMDLEVENARDGAPITQSVWKFGGGSQTWSIFVPGCRVDTEAYYAIVALHSGQVLTVRNNSIVQWPYLAWGNQLWQFQSVGEGFYNLRSKVSGVIAGVTDDEFVMAVPETLSLEKQWYMYNSTEGTCSIYSRKYRKVLDIAGGSMERGARVVIYGAENERHQRWTFIKVDKAPKLPKTCYTPPIDALHTKLIHSGDAYVLQDKSSDMDLEVPMSATDNFAPIRQWEKKEANTTVQKWKIRPVPVECGLYKIVSDHNDRVLTADPEYNSIFLESDDGGNNNMNQMWSISLEEETYFNIVSRGTMKALETSGNKNGSLVVQSDWKHHNKGQEWSFMGVECEVEDKFYYAIVAKTTGKVLTKNTEELVQWSYNGDDSQLWKFVRQKTGYQIVSKTTSQFITLDSEGNSIKMNTTGLTPWKINNGGLGYCNIMTEGDNVMGTDADKSDEKRVGLHNSNSASNQQWNFIKIEGSITTN